MGVYCVWFLPVVFMAVGGVGVSSAQSPLSVGGQVHHSIRTAHQVPYKQLLNRALNERNTFLVCHAINHMCTFTHKTTTDLRSELITTLFHTLTRQQVIIGLW